MTINPLKNSNHTDSTMSMASPTKGYWYYFHHDNNQIAVYGSGFTGKEIVYLNDDPVSESRSFGLKSRHEFTSNGKDYKVELKVNSMIRGDVECSLYINNEPVGTESKALISNSNGRSTLKTLAIILAVSFAAGILVGLTAATFSNWFA
jgi:hypothetical protein